MAASTAVVVQASGVGPSALASAPQIVPVAASATPVVRTTERRRSQAVTKRRLSTSEPPIVVLPRTIVTRGVKGRPPPTALVGSADGAEPRRSGKRRNRRPDARRDRARPAEPGEGHRGDR